MRIVVTGSSGFLGRHVVDQLLGRGHSVIEFDLQDGMNIFDTDQLENALHGVDICMHLAAIADLYQAEADHEVCMEMNVTGAEVVGKKCADLGVRLLFISTVCAYGNNSYSIQVEEAPLMPTEVYAESKAVAEQRLVSIPGLDLRIARPATFYGPKMRDSLAVSIFMRRVLKGQSIQVHGDGHQTRCYTHVEDVASGLVFIAEAWPSDIVFNLAGSEECSVLELIDHLQSIVGKVVEVEHVSDRIGQIHSSKISSERLRSLGWNPKYTLRSGLQHTIEQEWGGV